MQNNLVFIGLILVLFGFILMFLGNSKDSKVAFVGLIGPFPFGFGNDKRLFVVTLGIAVVLAVVWFFLSRKL